MFSLVNNAVMMFLIAIAILSFHQLIVVYGQDFFGLPMNVDQSESFDLSSLIFMDDNQLSDDLINQLNDFYPGNTIPFEGLGNIIMNSGMDDDDDCYELQFDNRISDLYESQLLVGQLENIDQITTVEISFYNDAGDPVRDSYGSPIQYTSNRQRLGHVIDILHQGFPFSYARCRLKLHPNSTFNPHKLFFHFSQRSPASASRTNTPYAISGPISFSIDTPEQSYNVSGNCPTRFTCMWVLDNRIINRTSSNSVTLTFHRRHVGNRTLLYVAHNANIPHIIASLRISILPSAQPDNITYTITGPTTLSNSTLEQSYNASGSCPYHFTCMWMLNNTVINTTSSNAVTLRFSPNETGNQTLSYVGFYSNRRWTLASLPISFHTGIGFG